MSTEPFEALAKLLADEIPPSVPPLDTPHVDGDLDWMMIDGRVDLLAVAAAVLRAGWRPPAQVITAPSDLDALPEETVIVIGGYAFQRFGGWWHGSGGVMPVHSEQLIDMHEGEAATVVWSPTETARSTE